MADLGSREGNEPHGIDNSGKGESGLAMHACVLSNFSRVRLFVTPWTAALQAPLSMGFSRQEFWSGLPCPPPGDLPNPGIEPASLMSPALAGGFFTTSATWKSRPGHGGGCREE